MVKKELSCGIITFDNDKVLLVKHNGGHTSFPKGHTEKWELLSETAIRETLEETGIEAEIISEVCFINTYAPKEKYMKDVLIFIGEKVGGTLKPQLEEVSLCDFFSYDDAMKELTYDIDKRILKQAYEIYKKMGE